MLSTYSSEHLQTDAFELRKLFLGGYLILDVKKQYSDRKSLIAKNFNGNTLKMKAVSAI